MQKLAFEPALKGMPSHMEQAEEIVFGRDRIDYLLLNVAPACNYACEKCFTWANTNKIKNYLKTEELLELVRGGHRLGAKVMGVIGEGEPLLYLGKLRAKQDLGRVIEAADALSMVTIVATNGSLLDEATTQFLYEHNCSVVVSMDTLDKKKYNEFYRGAASFDKLMKNLAHARKVFAQDIYCKNGKRVHRLGVHMTVTARNYHLIPDIKAYCGDDIFFDCDHIAPVGIALENFTALGGNEGLDLCTRASQSAGTPMVITKGSCGKSSCALFYFGLAIGYEGEVMIDTHAIETKHIVGHIRDAPLDALLDRAQAFRDRYFEQYGDHPCIIRNPRYRDFLQDMDDVRAAEGRYARKMSA
jgi:MoaA/NifB/PqqE/SkfB family radical SAM enzyme